jgi:hypothetical protein
MQNKPNLLDAKMNVTPLLTNYYENLLLYSLCKNKPNQTQFLTQNWLCFSPKITVKWLAKNIVSLCPCGKRKLC